MVRMDGKMDGAHYRMVCDGNLLTGAELHLQPRNVKQQSSELRPPGGVPQREESGAGVRLGSTLLPSPLSGKNPESEPSALGHIESRERGNMSSIRPASSFGCLNFVCG